MTHHSHAFNNEKMVEIIEVAGELASGITNQAITLCKAFLEQSRLNDPIRILDLGCGPGVATRQLASAFPSASVLGVDNSPTMLERAKDGAVMAGISDRIEWRLLDLDDDLSELGSADLVWAALALHHAKDEQSALDNFARLVHPGSLLCLVERASHMAVTAANDLGRANLWERVIPTRGATCRNQ